MRRTLPAVTALAASLMLTACGGSQDDPISTAYAFAEATVDLDAKDMCKLMLDEDDKPMADDKDALKDCETELNYFLTIAGDEDDEMEELKKEFKEVKKKDLVADLDEDEATVEIMDDDIDLKKVDGSWYVEDF